MVDRGGNLEGWSPQSSGGNSNSYHPPPPAAQNNFNSHRQVYMQQLQNFSTNFAHLTNGGYPPGHYGGGGGAPLPAHHAASHPQGQGMPYGQCPLPAHLRSNPYQSQSGYRPPLHYNYQQHVQQQPQQQPPNYSNYIHHPGDKVAAPSSYPQHNGYYKREFYGGHHPHHGGNSYVSYPPPHPPVAQHEAPMNLTPKASSERTILNTPQYPLGHPSGTKAETISVPTCIPIVEPFQQPPMMITPSVSWKRKAEESSAQQQYTQHPNKRIKEGGEELLLARKDLKENNNNSSLACPPPPTTTTVEPPLIPHERTASGGSSTAKQQQPRKKRETPAASSLKQVQQQVLQEQQQIMRVKSASKEEGGTNGLRPLPPPPPPPLGDYPSGGQPTYYTPNSPSYPPPPQVAVTSSPPVTQPPPPVSSVSQPPPPSVPKPSSTPSNNLPPKKGGTLWALPIVPKLPQKPSVKPERKPALHSSKDNSNPPASFKDVWLSAFGANKSSSSSNKSTTTPPSSNNNSNESNTINSSNGSTSPGANNNNNKDPVEHLLPLKKKKMVFKTYLDIPPEHRRRPRPVFGGIIHFSPDWEKAVRAHHEKCRLPSSLVEAISVVAPKILQGRATEEEDPSSAKSSSSLASASPGPLFENSNPEDDLSPQTRPSSSLSVPFSTSAEAPRSVNTVVDSILENRKKLRTTISRMYKKPRRHRLKSEEAADSEGEGEDRGGQVLMPTPGLPGPHSNPSEILMGSNYGNFRRQTLLRYLEMDQASDLKAKMLDWKPEVFETKTRRQSNQVRAVTAYREIFGIDLPERFTNGKSSSPLKKKKRPYVKKAEREALKEEPTPEVPVIPPPEIKKEVLTPPPLAEEEEEPEAAKVVPLPTPTASTSSRLNRSSPKPPPKKSFRKGRPQEHHEEEDEPHEPTASEEALQAELQSFALSLLESNPSWGNKVVIQNLVIWEPIDPVPYVPEKKPKKYYHRKARKRKSGMDFNTPGRTKKAAASAKSSRSSPEPPAQVVDVLYTLDQVISESKSWVIDKGAGETILHRAAKMGYPDVLAYALDMLKIPPNIKDNAGIPPIHKAAFRGHGRIVSTLLRYGEDPNTNVKGTRPLHEALEGGDPLAVYHLLTYGSDPLLYDYSGNMPIDLTEGDEDMRAYLSGILSDLHGKTSTRWNVSAVKEYVQPPEELMVDDSDDSDEEGALFMEFETSSSPLPPYYQFKEYEGHFVKASDLKSLPESLLTPPRLLEMPTEDFIKNSHCCLLGGPPPPLNPGGVVRLLRLDEPLKKYLGVTRETLGPA